MTALVGRVVAWMATMRAAIILLGLSALASMAGTVLEQGLPLRSYVAEFGPFWAKVFWYLGLTDVFRAWWFVAIMAVLLLSVSTCIIRNGPARLRRVWWRGKLNYRKLGYFGVHVGVLGVAIAGMLSAWMGWRATMNLREKSGDNVALQWKQAAAIPHFLPFRVSNEDFSITQYPSGMPERYATTLRFDFPDGRAEVKQVAVNQPVHEGGYTFYQSSFGDGGTGVKGVGVKLSNGAAAAFEGHIYDRLTLPDGTKLQLLDFRPFTVVTLPGQRPMDVGPSLDYLVQPPDAEARQLRAYLNHPEIVGVAEGQKHGGFDDGAVIYEPVLLGVRSHALWPLVARVAQGEDFKKVVKPFLAGVRDEDKRVAMGLEIMQAAKVVKAYGLTHLLILQDYQLKRYSGLQVVRDPGSAVFWPSAVLLLAGVVLMLAF